MTKAYDVGVLAKWQVVIPKELRDELGISSWDNLYCFQRGSSIILKKKTTVIPLVQFTWKLDAKIADREAYLAPLWKDDKNNTYGLSAHDMLGVTYMIGVSGQGKAVNALNQIYTDIMAGTSVVVIDPYGDRIAEIKNYVEHTPPLHILEYTVDASGKEKNMRNRQAAYKELTHMDRDQQKIVLINLNVKAIGRYQSHDLGCQIVHDLWKHLAKSPMAIYIDEASAYLDDASIALLGGLRKQHIKCVLLDESLDGYSHDQAKALFAAVRHLVCYKSTWLTAKFLVEHLHLNISAAELKDMQKYHFYAKIDAGKEPTEKRLQGIYPIG